MVGDEVTEFMCEDCVKEFNKTEAAAMWRAAYMAKQSDLADFIYVEYVRHQQDRLPK